jgi:hypothetical protein
MVCLAQEGHPLSGTWHGTWGPNATDRTDVTLVMSWDGTLSGIVNPGLRSAKMQKAALDASNWGVHFEADLKDRSGAVAHVVADGKIEDVTNVRRSIVGAWTQGSVKGDFKVIRDN